MATFDDFYRSLPEDNATRGDFFEKVFVPWFLKTDPEWSSKVNQIWLWNEYPQRWGKDCGIDLVYEDKEGKHWAVQSKCVSPDREVTKSEIDSFLSESNDPRIYGRLLIASTDGIGKNAQQVIERQEKQVVCFLLEHFRQSEIEFPSSPNDLSSGKRKDRRTPRLHQQEAIQSVVAGLQTQDRGQLLMACGTGKTLTSLWIKEELKAKRTLVLVPSLSLLSQTIREWTATSRDDLNWICVCSDKSVAKKDKIDDAWIEHSSELGVSVTNEITDIQRFLWVNEEGIIFATYQSSPLVAEVQQDPDVPDFDIVFADEAHRCAGKVSEAFGSVLVSQKIRAKKRLFMTATPRVLSSRIKTKADAENIEVASMDDEGIFGKVLHRLNFSEAISKELLTDYRVVVIGVDDPEIQAQIIHRPLSATSNGVETDYETLANHISLAKAIRDYDLQRVITFHGRVKGAKKFSEDHPAIVDWLPDSSKSAKEIQVDYVSGHMNSLERNNKIGQLRNLEDGQIGILSNARCLSEGVDVPSLDGIAFIDPRSSQVDIIQAVGRAIRKSESKQLGYIILPVYLGDTEKIEEEILASRFKDIWKVILALKSQDDSLSEVLDRLRVELGKRGESESRDEGLTKIIFDLPQRVMNRIGDSLQTILLINTAESWQEMYGKLLDFADTNGHACPSTKDEILGRWINTQRVAYGKEMLSERKVRLLEGLKGWVWDKSESAWNQQYQELIKYTEEKGTAKPPRNHETLGLWVTTQRQFFKKGKLTARRTGLLDCLEGWTWDPYESCWEERYQELAQYVCETGAARPPISYPVLGSWVVDQRSSFKNGDLSNERIIKLEGLDGWVWDPFETDWQENYQKLVVYANTNGSAKPPTSHQTLGAFTQRQRALFRKGKLSAERINLLEILDGWSWDPVESEWKEKYKELVKYVRDTGEANPPQKYQTIGKWVNKQRMLYKQNRLSQERIDLLEILDGWIWNPKESEWERKYKELVQYAETSGSANPPASHKTLGNWVNNKRSAYKRGELPKERIALLENLEGWVWSAKT